MRAFINFHWVLSLVHVLLSKPVYGQTVRTLLPRPTPVARTAKMSPDFKVEGEDF